MTTYINQGNTYFILDDASIIKNDLGNGTYSVSFNEMAQRYELTPVDNFTIPSKLYGNSTQHANRIIKSYIERNGKSTGVALSGDPGSGKTMLARVISRALREEHGFPTLVINSPLYGEDFNKFVQAITQPCVIVFDEFEKVYDYNSQSALLTLFDGTYNTNKLFIITSNDKYSFRHEMRNRPGRFYYMIEFAGVDEQFIREYCQDVLNNKDNIDGVVAIASIFSSFSFDMLKAIVEEMNRFNETAADASRLLNIKPELVDDGTTYNVEVLNSKNKVIYQEEITVNPFSDNFGISFHNENEDKFFRYQFSPADFKARDKTTGRILFENKRKERVAMTRIVDSNVRVLDYL